MKASSTTRALKRSGRVGKDLRHDLTAYGLLSPQIIGLFVFTLYPILWAVRMSGSYYTGVPSATHFVGLDNYKNLFANDIGYWKAIGNSFLFTIGKLPFELPLALLLASVLNRKLRGSNTARILFYIPNVVSVAVIGILFSNLFSYFGYINGVLMKFGLSTEGVDFFASKRWAMFMVILSSVWQTFGVNTIYFLAAFQNVPEEIYESARLDGAGPATMFFRITMPMIMPVFRVILLLAINGSMQSGDIILNLTNGGPAGQTEVAMTYLLKAMVPGFASSGANIGYGCSMGVINAVIMAAVAILYMRLSKSANE